MLKPSSSALTLLFEDVHWTYKHNDGWMEYCLWTFELIVRASGTTREPPTDSEIKERTILVVYHGAYNMQPQ